MKGNRDYSVSKSEQVVVFRGVPVGQCEQRRIRDFVADRPQATQVDLARGVCKLFGWQRPNGEPPVRGCTALLVRLESMGVLRLPAVGQRRAPRQSGMFELTADLVLEPATLRPVSLDPSAPLVVRPIVEAERLGWQAYMQRFHYLGNCRLVGESLRYVALLGDELVALLGWGAASLSNEPRDHYVGWERAAKALGLHQVVNNVRYLIVPWIRLPNLASRILGANLRRLSADWEAVYGHHLLLAETFVDGARFTGTCYRASNWRYLGETKGFAKRGSHYSFHGRPKAVFVYPLHRQSTELLCIPSSSARPGAEHKEDAVRTLRCENLPLDGQGGLFEVLDTIEDPRKRRGVRYYLQSVLAVAVSATLAGAKTFGAIAEWAADQDKDLLKRMRCWRGQAPSERTFRRVLMAVNAEEVDTKVGTWFAGLSSTQGRGIAVDGKTLRGSRDGKNGRAVHLLSAVVHGTGEVVAQTRVDQKTNEITRVAPLFDGLDISGAVVTADALLTQREIARHLVEDKHADYVFTVKDNQSTVRKDISDLFESRETDAQRRQAASDKPPTREAFPPSARDRR